MPATTRNSAFRESVTASVPNTVVGPPFSLIFGVVAPLVAWYRKSMRRGALAGAAAPGPPKRIS